MRMRKCDNRLTKLKNQTNKQEKLIKTDVKLKLKLRRIQLEWNWPENTGESNEHKYANMKTKPSECRLNYF